MHYEALFVDPTGRSTRREYGGALATLLAAFVFYYVLVLGPSGRFGMLVMLYPAVVLHARRLHDMGHAAWPLVAPAALLIAAFWLRMVAPGTAAQSAVSLAALVVSAGFVLWGLLGPERTSAA